MSELQTQREWAAERGLCKAGVRGRLPKAAKIAIAKAMESGVQFSDVQAVKRGGNVEVQVIAAPNNAVVDIPEYIRDVDHEVYEFDNGKKIHRSMREVCRRCRVSLVICGCNNPRIAARDGNPDGVTVFFGKAGYGEVR